MSERTSWEPRRGRKERKKKVIISVSALFMALYQLGRGERERRRQSTL